jgi:hypothetical protein
MKYTSDEYYNQIDYNIQEIYNNNSCTIFISNQIIDMIEVVINEIYLWLSSHVFESPEKEIYFFKNQKPRLISLLIYHIQIIDIESNLPASKAAKIKYYKKKIAYYSYCTKKNKGFNQYIKSKDSSYDYLYFIRKQTNKIKFLDGSIVNYDNKVSTSHDYLIALINANDQIIKYLEEKIENINNKTIGKTNSNLQWTGNKIELIELIYALQSNKSINKGNSDIKELAIKLGNVFNIEIEDNIYRNYLDIKNRKIERTKFLNVLSESLLNKIQKDDI